MDEQPPRKRVRTGCLTCRGRRRKCDEQKPECVNCRSKGLACRYGGNLTFVTSKLQDRLESTPQNAARATSKPDKSRAPVPEATSPAAAQYLQAADDFLPAERSSLHTFSPTGLGSGPENDFVDRSSAAKLPRTDSYQASLSTVGSYDYPAPPSHSAKPSPVRRDGNTRREKYEVELFTHYCYHVAPVLDLGLGSLSFGVQTVLDSKVLEPIYHAILAVASSHRVSMGSMLQAVDEATSVASAHLAHRELGDPNSGHPASSDILLLWRSLLLAPIESWSSLRSDILLKARNDVEVLEEWQVLSRLHIAASLIEPPTAHEAVFPPPPFATLDGRVYEHSRQLGLALWLLEQSLAFLVPKGNSSSHQIPPLAQTWLARWQELQHWFIERSEDMRQILELVEEEDESTRTQFRERLSFPCIVFSHASAVVANVAHHLASMILLQNKMRLIKPVAGPDSSTSALWHMQRAIGMISAATDAKIWDPFLTAGLLYAARQLSHGDQIQTVSRTMRQIQTLSGLDLGNAIRDLDRR